jgi:hypothetical protein
VLDAQAGEAAAQDEVAVLRRELALALRRAEPPERADACVQVDLGEAPGHHAARAVVEPAPAPAAAAHEAEPRSGCPEGADHPTALYLPPRAVGADSGAGGAVFAAPAPLLPPLAPAPPAPAPVVAPALDPATAALFVAAGLVQDPAAPGLGPAVLLFRHPASAYRLAVAPGPERGGSPSDVAVVPLGGLGGLGPHLPPHLRSELLVPRDEVPLLAQRMAKSVQQFDAAHKVA